MRSRVGTRVVHDGDAVVNDDLPTSGPSGTFRASGCQWFELMGREKIYIPRRRGRGNVGIPKGFPRSVRRVGSRLWGFPCFPYSVISMACFRAPKLDKRICAAWWQICRTPNGMLIGIRRLSMSNSAIMHELTARPVSSLIASEQMSLAGVREWTCRRKSEHWQAGHGSSRTIYITDERYLRL
jgi:hypothetical protein